jgi:hypothetical protein
MTLSFCTRRCLQDKKQSAPSLLQKPIRLCVTVLTKNYGYSKLGFAFTKQLPRHDVLVIYISIISLSSHAVRKQRECIANTTPDFGMQNRKNNRHDIMEILRCSTLHNTHQKSLSFTECQQLPFEAPV